MVVGGWAWSSPLVRGRTGWTVYDVRPAIVPSRTPSYTASAPLPLVRPGPIQEEQPIAVAAFRTFASIKSRPASSARSASREAERALFASPVRKRHVSSTA